MPEPWAGKVTGMLLEMNSSELLRMLNYPEVLTENTNEALLVLSAHQLLQHGFTVNHPMLDERTQRYMCGLLLSSSIAQKAPAKWCGKIAGMFLELECAELVNLVEFREALDKKIDEAASLLHAREQQAAVVITRFICGKYLNDCPGKLHSQNRQQINYALPSLTITTQRKTK